MIDLVDYWGWNSMEAICVDAPRKWGEWVELLRGASALLTLGALGGSAL